MDQSWDRELGPTRRQRDSPATIGSRLASERRRRPRSAAPRASRPPTRRRAHAHTCRTLHARHTYVPTTTTHAKHD
ncbi:hypothetical protein RR48_08708 [Papilio machaon]|uniref:Uncharacterized protein n=1 Tax=Papilio machaon TaxID=76193 RepID=A0A194R8R6_PAPMA|nr:hypothetical protein RR48_08708 [Papilio machaon]